MRMGKEMEKRRKRGKGNDKREESGSEMIMNGKRRQVKDRSNDNRKQKSEKKRNGKKYKREVTLYLKGPEPFSPPRRVFIMAITNTSKP